MGGAPAGQGPEQTCVAGMGKLRGYYELARECLRRGVEADESQEKAKAAQLYNQFLEIAQEALLLDVAPSYSQSAESQRLLEELVKFSGKVHSRLGDLRRQGVHSGAMQQSSGSRPASGAGSWFSASGWEAAQAEEHANPRKSSWFDFGWGGQATTTHVQKSPPLRDRPMGSAGGGQRATAAFQQTRPPRPLAPPRGMPPAPGPITRPGPCSRLHTVDPKLLEAIESEILDRRPTVRWEDIAGLHSAKQALQEMVILPTLRRDLFQGIRKPARGLLLFGPPGNGKTMLARAVASQAQATFFNVSASSLTSKWMGEGEKLVRALFSLAAERQPSVIFIDEVDSILSERSQGEHEASRRLKTEFLVQFDGVLSSDEEHVVVMGATNRPEELDEAARRRLVKRIYIPLPDDAARTSLLEALTSSTQTFRLSGGDLETLVRETKGYSGSDLRALCQEAAMGPIRELGASVASVKTSEVRKVFLSDFRNALQTIKPSVSAASVQHFEEWARQYGSS